MKIDWNKIWEANQNLFIMSGFEECPEEKRRSWHLSSQFCYFATGDMNLRVGIISSRDAYKDEDFLGEGISWASRIGNGARTVLYFVAQDFSPVFLNAISKLGGLITAKAIYWREKLTPSLYPVQEKDYLKTAFLPETLVPRPQWSAWQKQLNPVAWQQLLVFKEFFESLEKRRVRAVLGKNKVVFCWGPFEIAEVSIKSNKIEISTKIKWTRNKNIAAKFLKTGWVDCNGNINDDFRRAVLGMIELLETMEAGRCFDSKNLLALRIIGDKEFFRPAFGHYIEYPWMAKNRNSLLNSCDLYYFRSGSIIHVIQPILEKPVQKIVQALLLASFFEYCDRVGLGGEKVKHQLLLLSQPCFIEELRLCQSWLKDRNYFPIYILPEDWKVEGLKETRELLPEERDF